MQDDESEVDLSSSVAPPLRQRRRITPQLRTQVVEAYEFGQTSRQVAETCGVGRSTVLKILKDAGVAVRPQGQKY
ncbi:helix-turn-helix domain-containing protein [Mycolicibacterium aubagnense]|uniref:helix-turn-helix domain-containing protein n=1 Tax=Mycolicibacterium aubagnense TaxID=319707 RepID=UPI0013D6357C